MIENLEPKPNMWETNPRLKMLSLVFIFVFLFSGIGLVIFSVWSNQYRQQIYNETEQSLPKHEARVSENQKVGVSDTSTWKTYKNDQYGFEFQYPARFNSEILNNELAIFKAGINGEGNFEARVREQSPSGLSLDKYLYLDFPISQRMELANQEAMVYKAPNGYCDGPGCSEPFIAVVTKRGTVFYHMIFYDDAEFSEEELMMVSTFKFTK